MARLYIIDDSLFVLTQLGQILQKGGHTVSGSAQNGEAALRFLEDHADEVDAITFDVTMPGLDGLEVLRRVRERWPDKTCIVVSGLARRDLVVQARELGAAGYLVKPLSRDAVLEKLAEVLPKPEE